MKNKISLIIMLFLACITSCNSLAQSAVAFCPKKYKVGLAYGAKDVAEAKRAALEQCKAEGGTEPYILLSTSSKGYGCVLMAQGTETGLVFIGASLACGSATEADALATRYLNKDADGEELENITTMGSFYDPIVEEEKASPPPAPAEAVWQKSADEQAVFDYFEKGDYAKVIEHAKKALTYRNTKEVVSRYIYAYLRLGKYEECKSVCDWVFDIGWTLEPDIYDYYAYSCFNLGKLDLALKGYTKAIEKGYKNKNVYRSRAAVYFQMHNYYMVGSDLKKYMVEGIDDNPAYAMRGVSRFYSMDEAGALADLNKAIQAGVVIPEAFLVRGKVFLKSKKYDDAETDIKKAAELTQNNFDVWYSLGQVYIGKNRPKDAIECLNKAIQLDPESSGAFMERGRAYRMLKMKKESDEDLNKALKINSYLEDDIKKIRKGK